MSMSTSFKPQESIEFITAAYLAQVVRGLEPDREKLIRSYPEYELRLREFFHHCDSFRLVVQPDCQRTDGLEKLTNHLPTHPLPDASSHSDAHSQTPWNDRTYQALREMVLDPSSNEIIEDLVGLEEEVSASQHPRKSDSSLLDSQSKAQAESAADQNLQPAEKWNARTDQINVDTSHAKSQWIGPYKLLQKIADGGMGSVWMAQQESPIRRRVAIKIIRPELDSRQIFARFDAERQALAIMSHPNIARVLDAGTADDGRPYFAMELVQGIPLTSYCDNNELTIRQRLELFLPVCQAVQHAHQKGIIHRDLKPSNILVTLYDGRPVPKVVDFGLAKALDHRSKLTDQTLYTEFGQVVGTLQYMSPEQAEMNSLDIDTRSDIYSLGVMVYELLTGSTPIERKTIDKNAVLQVLQSIRETDPPRPSLRLSESADVIEGISSHRKIEPKRLSQMVQGDLDWIVMKALEKDRSRRYPTATSLAEDLERYLQSKPIVARPPSFSYLLSKFFVKHRNACLAAIAMLVLLVFGLIGTSIGLWQADSERRAANIANQQTKEAKKEQERQRIEADKNATRAIVAEGVAKQRASDLQRIVELQKLQLTSIDIQSMATQLEAILAEKFEVAKKGITKDSSSDSTSFQELSAKLNFVDISRAVLQKSIFDPYVDLIEAKYLDQPEVAISVLNTISKIENDLGLHEASLRPSRLAFEQANEKFGKQHSQTLQLMSGLSLYLAAAGKRSEAESLCEETLKLRRSKLGDSHPDTLHSMNDLAGLLLDRGKLDEAEELFSKTLEGRRIQLGLEDPDTIMSVNNMGGMMQMRGKFDEAEKYYRTALDARRRLLGNENYETLMSINNLGFATRKLSRWAEAEQLFREGLETSRRVLGNDHPMTAFFASNMGFLLRDQSRWNDSEPYFREAYELRKRVLGEKHPDTLIAMNNVASIYEILDRNEEAEELYRDALKISTESSGDAHPNTIAYRQNLAAYLIKHEKLDEAYKLLEEAYVNRVQLVGEFDPESLDLLIGLVSIDRKMDRDSEYTKKIQPALDHFGNENDMPELAKLRKYAR